MPQPYRVAFLGFSAFERSTLASCFRLAGARSPSYEQVAALADADLIVADADHAPSVQRVQAAGRIGDTVFIGAQPPEDAVAWMRRPIDPLNVTRELDAMLALATGVPPLPAPVSPDASAWSVSPAQAPAVLPAAPTPLPAAPTASALLIDDSPIALLYLQKCLGRYDLHIESTTSSSHAMLLLSRRDFDFAFIDVELGADSPLDGLALCQHVKRAHLQADAVHPVVMMVSAHHSELDRVRGTFAGCDAYLGKPLDEGQLERLLRRHGLKPRPQEAAVPAA